VARGRQETREGWAARKKASAPKKKPPRGREYHMGGIVGYVETRARPDHPEGPQEARVRGYDSAGWRAGPEATGPARRRPHQWTRALMRENPVGSIGWPTRWATPAAHRRERASHTTTRQSGVVHNGSSRTIPSRRPISEGHVFKSERTPSIAHLIERHLRTRRAWTRPRAGRCELPAPIHLVLARATPDRWWRQARAGSVVVGLGAGNLSPPPTFPRCSRIRGTCHSRGRGHRRVTPNGWSHQLHERPPTPPTRILWNPILAEKGGKITFMLKEIYEQPRARRHPRGGLAGERSVCCPTSISSRNVTSIPSRPPRRGLPTTRHRARFLSSPHRPPGPSDVASEVSLTATPAGPDTWCWRCPSPARPTTLAASRPPAKGAPIIGITNGGGSRWPREATGIVYTPAGPRSAWVVQDLHRHIMAGYLLALWLGRHPGAIIRRPPAARAGL